MKVEEYERDYEDYEILGTYHEGAGTEAKYPRPLEMTAYYNGKQLKKDKDWQRFVMPYIVSDYFRKNDCPELYEIGTELRENCLAIVKGEHPEWHIGYAELLPEALSLSFSNPKNEMLVDCTVLITAKSPVKFQIIGSEMAPGITPVYMIHSFDGHMVVNEEIRIQRREIHFQFKDPNKERVCTWYDPGNMCMKIREHSWN